jgi:hypothetical protein
MPEEYRVQETRARQEQEKFTNNLLCLANDGLTISSFHPPTLSDTVHYIVATSLTK